jgi:hypothetical protein
MAETGDKSIHRDRYELGATGEHPGELGPNDEGGLFGSLTIDRDKNVVVLDFGKSLAWVAMTRAEATILGNALVATARQLKPSRE